jgi:putative oxidoreductase
MRDPAVLALRLSLGSYLAVHGAQKLFGSFGGPGLDRSGSGFERMGLTPGKAFAGLAGGSELAGGILTATGTAHPLGPLVVAGAMTVASLTHADKGPLAQKGGFELPASYLGAAIALAGVGPGRYSVDRLTGFQLPRALMAVVLAGAAALTVHSAVRVVTTKRAAAARAAVQAISNPAGVPAAAASA